MLTLPESVNPVAAPPTLTLPLAVPVTEAPPVPLAILKLAVPPLTDTRPPPSDRLRLLIVRVTVPVPGSLKPKLPDNVCPKTVTLSLVPLTLRLPAEKLTVTLPLTETPVEALPIETWPLNVPLSMWPLLP